MDASPQATQSQLALEVAGVTIQVVSDDVRFRLDRASEPFRVAPRREPDILLRARLGDPDSAPPGDTRTFDSGGVWTLNRAGAERISAFARRGSVLAPTRSRSSPTTAGGAT